MVKTTIIASSIFLAHLLNAQPHEHTGMYEERGSEILEKASETIMSYNSLIFDFSYSLENPQHNLDRSSPGNIYIEKDKYFMTFDSYEYISDGNTVWAILKDVGEIHVSYAENIDQSMNPVRLLTDFQEHYNAKLIREEMHDGKNVYLVDAIPNQPQAFFKYRVAINTDNNMLEVITAYDRHGGNYTININKIEKNPEIPAGKFVFEKSEYPDMDVIDLR